MVMHLQRAIIISIALVFLHRVFAPNFRRIKVDEAHDQTEVVGLIKESSSEDNTIIEDHNMSALRPSELPDGYGRFMLPAKWDDASSMHYQLYLPKDHPGQLDGVTSSVDDKKWPLIVFLHGAGESGSGPDQIDMLLGENAIGATGTPTVMLAQGVAPPLLYREFVVAAPQTNRGWSGSAVKKLTNSLLKDSSLRIDVKRMYLTGVSMGGGGTLRASLDGFGKLFAALAPVCPAGRASASNFDGIPMWFFHGANDRVVPVGVSDDLVDALLHHRGADDDNLDTTTNDDYIYKRLGTGKNELRYTRYKKSPAPVGWETYDGHASWMQSYATDELFEWLLSKTKD